jgi:hypothetical protein
VVPFINRIFSHLICGSRPSPSAKFVRVRPGSMLQLLHPSSRYSADRCILCGGSFRDHLSLWWYLRGGLYSPYDRYVDSVLKDGVELSRVSTPAPTRPRRRKRKWFTSRTRSPEPVVRRESRRYVFHRRYVHEIEPKHKSSDRISYSSYQNGTTWYIEKHALIAGRPISYRFPLWDERPNTKTTSTSNKSKSGKPSIGAKPPSIMPLLVKGLLLPAVEHLMYLEERDNRRTDTTSLPLRD